MNPVFPARKRAEEFSSMVEDSSITQLRTGPDSKHADLLPLVGLVTSLRSTPAPEARPEFVSDLRSRLMLAAETALAPDSTQQLAARRTPAQRRTSRERRLAVAVGGFALVSASASMSVAAQTALPGDTLYPLKRALENAHENVLHDADDKGTTMLDNASGRLDEVDELSRSGGEDADVIAQTLQDFTSQAVEASDLLLSDYADTGRVSSIKELRSFTAASLQSLKRLEGLVPIAVRTTLIEAARVLDDIDRQVLSACPTCGTAAPAIAPVRAGDVGPIYDELLEELSSLPETITQPTAPQQQTPPPASSSGQKVPPINEPSSEPTAEEPGEPVLPTGPSGNDGKPPATSDLGTIVTGLGDPVGDLLTGVQQTVEQILPGTKPKK